MIEKDIFACKNKNQGKMLLKKNFAYNVALQALNVLFPLVTVPYISRVLGVENVGIVSFINTYANYFVFFAMFGISYYGVREIAKIGRENKEKTNQLFSELFRINLIATIVVSIIYIATTFLIPEFRAYQWLYIVGGMSIYLVPISIDWFFQGQENFRLITIRSAVIKTLSFIGLFVFVRERDDLLAYIALSSFAIVGNQVWNIIYATKKGLKIYFSKLNIKQHLKSMGVFFLSHISVSIYLILDVLMLGFLSTYEQVGLYTSPSRIIFLLLVVIGAINTVLIPRLSANNANKEHIQNNILLQNAFDAIMLIIIPASIGLCLCSSRFVPMFFGYEFVGSIIPMQILSLNIIFSMMNIFFVTNVLIILGYEKKYLFTVIITAIFSFILNLICIPRLGAIGASIGSVFAQSFEMFLNLYFVYKLTPIRVKWINMIKATICSIAIVAIYWIMDTCIITTSLSFLVIFIGASALVYLILQRYIARNYILIDTITLLKKRLK
ncbi:MAG: flippase [Chitinophagaceae bacterium]